MGPERELFVARIMEIVRKTGIEIVVSNERDMQSSFNLLVVDSPL